VTKRAWAERNNAIDFDSISSKEKFQAVVDEQTRRLAVSESFFLEAKHTARKKASETDGKIGKASTLTAWSSLQDWGDSLSNNTKKKPHLRVGKFWTGAIGKSQHEVISRNLYKNGIATHMLLENYIISKGGKSSLDLEGDSKNFPRRLDKFLRLHGQSPEIRQVVPAVVIKPDKKRLANGVVESWLQTSRSERISEPTTKERGQNRSRLTNTTRLGESKLTKQLKQKHMKKRHDILQNRKKLHDRYRVQKRGNAATQHRRMSMRSELTTSSIKNLCKTIVEPHSKLQGSLIIQKCVRRWLRKSHEHRAQTRAFAEWRSQMVDFESKESKSQDIKLHNLRGLVLWKGPWDRCTGDCCNFHQNMNTILLRAFGHTQVVLSLSKTSAGSDSDTGG
jgi:hypothetical protein